MNIQISTPLLLCGLGLLFAGCRKELCYDHDEHSHGYRLEIAADWELEWERHYGRDWVNNWENAGTDNEYDYFRPNIPEGLAVILYDEEDDDYVQRRELHLPSLGGNITIDKSTRAMLFHNDDSEYIIISNMASLATASATTRTRTRASLAELHRGERTVSPPDMLYGAYIEDYEPEAVVGYKPMQITLRPLVYSYVIRFNIKKNAQYVALARGALAGMAESIYLKDGTTSNTSATLLFDCEQTSYGFAVQLMSFGIPGFPDEYYSRADDESDDRRYDINLELKLTNGKTLTYDIEVTDQLKDQPNGGVINIDNIEIPDEEVKTGGTGAFDATVEDWGDQTDIDLPL